MGRGDSLKRRKPRRNPLPRILIVCEGIRTEEGYFRSLRHAERIPIDLKVPSGGTPKTLVEWAVSRKREADAAAKSSGDPNLRFDEVWCVFDVDEHHQIQVAISNPVLRALGAVTFQRPEQTH
jgi:hypothetical protein